MIFNILMAMILFLFIVPNLIAAGLDVYYTKD